MTRAIPYLIPLAILILRRHAAAAWLGDTLGHPPRYLIVALGTWSLVTVGAAVALVCVLWLVVYWWTQERPLNRRRP